MTQLQLESAYIAKVFNRFTSRLKRLPQELNPFISRLGGFSQEMIDS